MKATVTLKPWQTLAQSEVKSAQLCLQGTPLTFCGAVRVVDKGRWEISKKGRANCALHLLSGELSR